MKNIYKNLKPYLIFGIRGGNASALQIINDAESKNTRFRYFMVAVKALQGGSTIQYSKLRFYNGNIKNCYPWCKDMTNFSDLKTYVLRINASGSTGASGEEAEYGLFGLGGIDKGNDGLEYGKMCYTGIFSKNTITIDGQKYACYAYDVDKANQGRKIDIATYNRWCWHSSNDTVSLGYGNRNMKDFNLYMSEDKTNWILVDEVVNCPSVVANYSLVYDGNVAFKYQFEGNRRSIRKAIITL